MTDQEVEDIVNDIADSLHRIAEALDTLVVYIKKESDNE